MQIITNSFALWCAFTIEFMTGILCVITGTYNPIYPIIVIAIGSIIATYIIKISTQS